MKQNLKRLIWLGVPVLLAVGCAENRRDPSVSYSPALSPTSDRMDTRAYPGTAANIDVTAAPTGANNQDWALAEQIRSLLMSDRKLADAPMKATVRNGVVTLRGDFRSNRERQKLREEIARIPGVQRVDDELQHGTATDLGPGEARDF